MTIVCPKCNADYTIDDQKLPARKASFLCKRCQHRITIEPPSTQSIVSDAVTDSKTAASLPAATAAVPHDKTLLSRLPEVDIYEPQKYALTQLLKPNKKGNYNTRINRLKLKLLKAVQPVLSELLKEDEQVRRIAAGTAYYPVELIFGNGWLTVLYNRYVLVATDKRLVAINTNYKMNKPMHYFFQYPFQEIKKVSGGLFGTRLVLSRKKGKRRIFGAIKRRLGMEMKAYIKANIDGSPLIDPAAALRDFLCPVCFAPLPGKLQACPQCRASFKTPRKAALRSLLLPGLGDIYLGHRFLGSMEILGSVIVWFVVLGLLITGDPEQVAIGLIILLLVNGADSLLTLHMAKKGYSIEKQQPQR